MKKAIFWEKAEDNGSVKCLLCPNACLIGDGRSGRCKVRKNDNGELVAAGYGKISSAHLDPIEKKPLYHFYPGSKIFSIGGWGCNLSCIFCQNWTISQQFIDKTPTATSMGIVAEAKHLCSMGIAYTYNEPMIGIEYYLDCAEKAKEAGLKNVLVTNGYINKKPAEKILEFADAMNVDIKSMSDEFYIKYCGAHLDPVLEFCKLAVKHGVHIEITNLIIPGLNDTDEMFKRLSSWIAEYLGSDVPLHLSAYYPQYKLSTDPTPLETVKTAYDVCKEDLKNVYMGNVSSNTGQNTYCGQCGNILISRNGYKIDITGVSNKLCIRCGYKTMITGL